ncbi:hypothetical protein ABPG73_000207 [Tetrahymena malaccensis]
MQSQDHFEKENNLKEDKEDKYCIVRNLTEATKFFLAETPDADFRHGRGKFFGSAILKNNAELLQLYIDTLQRNYIDKKQKESEAAGNYARFKLKKYLKEGLYEAEAYNPNLDDVKAIIKKYIPIDEDDNNELDRSQDIENDFPKDMKDLPDLSN